MTLKDNGDGTIHDSRTGLVWQQAENAEEMNYEDAVAFCESLTLAGHSNWRLPTKEELVALARVGDKPLREFFPGIQQERYWAFTSLSELAWAESPDRIAYTVDFDPDSGNYCRPTTYFRVYTYFVRAVRTGGEALPPEPVERAVRTGREALPTESEASRACGYKVQHILSGHNDMVRDCTFSPDGTRIVTASHDKTARVWDAATGAELAVLAGHTERVVDCAFSPDGARIVTASVDKTARVWDAATGAELVVLSGHTGEVLGCAFSPDGALVVSASEDKTARVWDFSSRLKQGNRLWSLLKRQRTIILSGHTGGVTACAFSPDGTRIVTASYDKTARVWDAATGAELAVLTGHADGLVACTYRCAYSPDGALVATNWDKTARVWDAATGAELAVLTGHTEGVVDCAFSPDGARIVTASVDKTARVWDAATGAELAVLTGHTGGVTACAFSPDGTRIVTASYDKTARVWDAATGAELVVLTGHKKVVGRCAFSPDGARIVTASSDGTARVWEMGAVPEMSPTTKPAQTSEMLLPNDALRALRARVEQLGVDHPRLQRPDLDPKLDLQLPWICRTLEEAASALESGRDPFGNPITDAQVASGLRKLAEMVRDPGYLSAMDLGHPGITAPLKRCMDDLAAIILEVEGVPATASPALPSKGVETLVALCTELGILFPNQYVNKAIQELQQEGEPGSRALAVLIRDLMECRSPKITYVLEAAGQVVSTPELLGAVHAVAEAPEMAEAPAHPRFTPDIIGGGRVGWTSGTHRRVVAKALQAVELLKGDD